MGGVQLLADTDKVPDAATYLGAIAFLAPSGQKSGQLLPTSQVARGNRDGRGVRCRSVCPPSNSVRFLGSRALMTKRRLLRRSANPRESSHVTL